MLAPQSDVADAISSQPWPADQVERWPIERLTPYPANPRLHSETDTDKIAASILKWGWTMPVLVDDGFRLTESSAILKYLADRCDSPAYPKDLKERARVRAVHAELAANCEAAITLSAPNHAPEGLGSTGNPEFNVPASLLGVPAVSLPLFELNEMPLGLQVIGYHDRDADPFAAAGDDDGTAGQIKAFVHVGASMDQAPTPAPFDATPSRA